jgi:lycopene elongase/hydratase (dihydrobisanhydrobacterioruberin-forming)
MLATVSSRARRYVACLRVQEILVLQGSALLGAAFAFRHLTLEHLGALFLLVVANLALVAHVFLINDWANVSADRIDPSRAGHVFTARGVDPGEMKGLAIGLLVISLVLLSALGALPLGIAVGIAVLSGLYSLPPFNWKSRPLLSSAAHLVGGVLHFLLGYCLIGTVDLAAVVLAAFFGVTFAAGHLIQELRDYETDVQNAIRTNAATFGKRPTLMASLALFTVAQVFLFWLALVGAVPRVLVILVLLYPLQLRWSLQALREGLAHASVIRLQKRYRGLYAVIGFVMATALWLDRA